MTKRNSPKGPSPEGGFQSAEMPTHIMVVGDDPHERQALEAILRGGGFDVTCPPDGLWALRDARGRRPDAILLSFQQSGAEPLDLCRQFKADPRTKTIPLICICDRQDPASRIKGLAAGCVDSITKPYPDQEVLRRVGTYVRLSRLERDLAAKAPIDFAGDDEVERRRRLGRAVRLGRPRRRGRRGDQRDLAGAVPVQPRVALLLVERP